MASPARNLQLCVISHRLEVASHLQAVTIGSGGRHRGRLGMCKIHDMFGVVCWTLAFLHRSGAIPIMTCRTALCPKSAPRVPRAVDSTDELSAETAKGTQGV